MPLGHPRSAVDRRSAYPATVGVALPAWPVAPRYRFVRSRLDASDDDGWALRDSLKTSLQKADLARHADGSRIWRELLRDGCAPCRPGPFVRTLEFVTGSQRISRRWPQRWLSGPASRTWPILRGVPVSASASKSHADALALPSRGLHQAGRSRHQERSRRRPRERR